MANIHIPVSKRTLLPQQKLPVSQLSETETQHTYKGRQIQVNKQQQRIHLVDVFIRQEFYKGRWKPETTGSAVMCSTTESSLYAHPLSPGSTQATVKSTFK